MPHGPLRSENRGYGFVETKGRTQSTLPILRGSVLEV
jgi:hypothetical protein